MRKAEFTNLVGHSGRVEAYFGHTSSRQRLVDGVYLPIVATANPRMLQHLETITYPIAGVNTDIPVLAHPAIQHLRIGVANNCLVPLAPVDRSVMASWVLIDPELPPMTVDEWHAKDHQGVLRMIGVNEPHTVVQHAGTGLSDYRGNALRFAVEIGGYQQLNLEKRWQSRWYAGHALFDEAGLIDEIGVSPIEPIKNPDLVLVKPGLNLNRDTRRKEPVTSMYDHKMLTRLANAEKSRFKIDDTSVTVSVAFQNNHLDLCFNEPQTLTDYGNHPMDITFNMVYGDSDLDLPIWLARPMPNNILIKGVETHRDGKVRDWRLQRSVTNRAAFVPVSESYMEAYAISDPMLIKEQRSRHGHKWVAMNHAMVMSGNQILQIGAWRVYESAEEETFESLVVTTRLFDVNN